MVEGQHRRSAALPDVPVAEIARSGPGGRGRQPGIFGQPHAFQIAAHGAGPVHPDPVRRGAAPGRREGRPHAAEILVDRAGDVALLRVEIDREIDRAAGGLADRAGLLIGGDRVRVAPVRRRNAPAFARDTPRSPPASCRSTRPRGPLPPTRSASATAGCGSTGQQNADRCPSAPAPRRGCRSPGLCRAPSRRSGGATSGRGGCVRGAAGGQKQQRQHETQPFHPPFPPFPPSGGAAPRGPGARPNTCRHAAHAPSGTGQPPLSKCPGPVIACRRLLPRCELSVADLPRRQSRSRVLLQLREAPRSPEARAGPPSSSASRSAGGESARRIGANERRWCGVTPSRRIASQCSAVAYPTLVSQP